MILALFVSKSYYFSEDSSFEHNAFYNTFNLARARGEPAEHPSPNSIISLKKLKEYKKLLNNVHKNLLPTIVETIYMHNFNIKCSNKPWKCIIIK